jgi:hypothetical protein
MARALGVSPSELLEEETAATQEEAAELVKKANCSLPVLKDALRTINETD